MGFVNSDRRARLFFELPSFLPARGTSNMHVMGRFFAELPTNAIER